LNSLNVTTNVTAQSFTGSFSGSVSAPGSTTQVVYNNNGVLAADSGLVYTGGSVGIGTVSPGYKLDVNGSSAFRNDMYLFSTSTYWYNGSSYFQATNLSNVGILKMTDNSSPIALQPNGGNVGIGTTSPGNKLHIVGAANGTDAGNIRIDSSNEFGGLVINENTTFRTFLGYGNAGNIFSNAQSDSTALRAANYLHLGASSVATITINGANDYVGIGTTSPGAELAVNSGNSNTRIFVQNVGSTKLEIGYGPTGYGFTHPTGEFIAHNDNLYFGQIASSATNITFTTTGNVGIGTTSPSSKLEVYTTTGDTKLTVTTTGGNSYVPRLSLDKRGDSAWNISSPAGGFNFAIDQDGTTRLWIASSTGNIGIGTTSPTATLEVNGNVKAVSFTGSFSGSITHAVSASYAVTASYALNAADSVWTGSGANIYYNLGNVGIGTTSPSYKLDVNGIGNFSNGFSDPSSETGYRLKFYDNGGIYNDAGIGLDGSGGGSEIMWFNALEGFYWGVGTGGTKMKLNNSGNLGIGTTSPSQILETYKSTNGDVAIQVTNPNAGASATAQFFASNGTTQTQFFHTGTSYNGTGILASSAGLGGIYNNTAQGIALLASSAAGPIRFGTTTSNTERMRIASDGNVGIGTTSPLYLLDLGTAGSGNQLRARRIYASGTGTDSGFTFDSTLIYQEASGTFNITNPGSYPNVAFTINNSGNVGIGTTSPTQKLAVAGTTDIISYTNGTTTGYLFSDNNGIGLFNGATASGTGIYARTSNILDLYINNSIAARINSSGNVGIGTTNPTGRLEVFTSSDNQLRLDASGTYSAMYLTQNQAVKGAVWMNHGSLGMFVGTTVSNGFLALGSDNSTEKVRITAAGNVGIGTNNPSQKLDVAGAISVSGSVVDYKVSPAAIAGVTTSNIVSLTPGVTKAAFIDYVIIDSAGGTNQRVGTIMVSISLNTVSAVITETTTVDIGNTSAVSFAVAYGPPVQITATNTGPTPYDISYMVRYF
jgi:hypothetical protein